MVNLLSKMRCNISDLKGASVKMGAWVNIQNDIESGFAVFEKL